jgi:hypothetical protein
MFDNNYFDKIDTSNKAYVLGLFYADGNLHKNTLQICLKDKELITFLKKEFKTTNKIVRDKNYFRITITGPQIPKQMNKLGIFERKSLILKFPTEDQVPKQLIKDFMRGFFDGDGWIQRNKIKSCKNPKWNFGIISTHEFCEKFLNILKINCNLPEVKIVKYKRIPEKDIWEVKLCGVYKNKIEKIYNFLYYKDCFCLKRKKDIFEKIIKLNPYSTKNSEYKGVTKLSENCYLARTGYRDENYKKIGIHIGCFKTEIEAAIAYNEKVKEIFGDKACSNYV